MRKIIREIIKQYYQGRYAPDQARFYVTPQHTSLVERRIEAEAHDETWREFIEYINPLFPDYTVEDKTQLGEESAYRMTVSFIDPVRKAELDKSADEVPSYQQPSYEYLSLYVSVLGPFIFYEIHKHETLENQQSGESPAFEQYREPEKTVAEAIHHFWLQRGYEILTSDEVYEPVTWVYEKIYSEDASVYNLLF